MKLKKSDFYQNNGYAKVCYDKPVCCPHCGVIIDATIEPCNCKNAVFVVFFTCTDVDCRKKFFGIYKVIGEIAAETQTEFLYVYPALPSKDFSEHLKNLSPNFLKAYNQAFLCEQNNHIELAVCGYRNAVEILIKDFAVKYKQVPPENLKRKSVADCIKAYLDNIEEVISAYMIKEFGNDAAHYPPDNEEIDFGNFMQFFNYFVSIIDNKILVMDMKQEIPPKFLQKFGSPHQSASAPDESNQ